MSYWKANGYIEIEPDPNVFASAMYDLHQIFNSEGLEYDVTHDQTVIDIGYADQRADETTIIDKCKSLTKGIRSGNIDFQYDSDPWEFDSYYRLTFDPKRKQWVEKRGHVVYETEESM